MQNKDKAGLASLPESSQWGDEIFDSQGHGLHNEDPGVNSDDEDDMFQVRMIIIYIVTNNNLHAFSLTLCPTEALTAR